MPADHISATDRQLAELLELTAAEAEDFARFAALRGAQGPVEEVRELVLAMLEVYHGPGRGDPDRLPDQPHHHRLSTEGPAPLPGGGTPRR